MMNLIKYVYNNKIYKKNLMILQNLFLTVIKTTGTNEGEVFYSMRPMVLRCMILSVVLRLGSWASDFDDGQVMIVYCKCVWLI